jgi:ABC-type uncharacterized transport system auxiliary subunit
VSRLAAAVALAASTALVGCVDLGPRESSPPRYFEPALANPPGPTPQPAADAPVLRLLPVGSAVHLERRMVWRRSEVEAGYWEDRRWLELPATYLERAAARTLFGTGRLRRTEVRDSPALALELLAFEEEREPEHRARVSVAVRLRDPAGVCRLEGCFERSVPVPEDRAEAVARALGDALDAVAAELADAVLSVLSPAPAP